MNIIIFIYLLLSLLHFSYGANDVGQKSVFVDVNSKCLSNCGARDSPFNSISDAVQYLRMRNSAISEPSSITLLKGRYSGEKNKAILIDFDVSIGTDIYNEAIIDCESTGYGFKVIGASKFIVSDIKFTRCNGNLGGALHLKNSYSTITNCVFINNTATVGGAIYSEGGKLNVISSIFNWNQVSDVNSGGGAIYQKNTISEIDMSDLTCNGIYSIGCSACSSVIDSSDNIQVKCTDNGQVTGSLTNNICTQTDTGISTCNKELNINQMNFKAFSVGIKTEVSGSCNKNNNCETDENCLSCPSDCHCKFSGFAACDVGSDLCFSRVKDISDLVFDQTKTDIVIRGYFNIFQKNTYSFLLTGKNVGIKMVIDGFVMINTHGIQDINSEREINLAANHIHMIEIYISSMSNDAKNLSLKFKKSNENSEYKPLSPLVFYSKNVCGDSILDEPEKDSSNNKYHCPSDYRGYPAKSDPVCGDGICIGTSSSCLEDCFEVVSPTCPGQAPPARLSETYSKSDSIGTLLDNQFIYNLPGIHHLAHGIDYLTGEQKITPIFIFGYCDNTSFSIIQDGYRGLTYSVPNGIEASISPNCAMETTSTSYSTSEHMSSEMFEQYDLSTSASIKGGFFVKVSASVSFSMEKSVASAREMESTNSGSLMVTEMNCVHSRVHITSAPEFHPTFVKDIANALNITQMQNVIKKYGMYYLISTNLGGKLKQVTLIKNVKTNSKTSRETSSNVQTSFNAHIKAPSIASVNTRVSGSLDSSTSQESQDSFESNSVTSSLKIYGGALGTFTPNEGEGNFDRWTTSIDLVPVPIKQKMAHISAIIPNTWVNRNGANIKELFELAEMKLMLSHYKPLYTFINGDMNNISRNDTIFLYDPTRSTGLSLNFQIEGSKGSMSFQFNDNAGMKAFVANNIGEIQKVRFIRGANNYIRNINPIIYDLSQSRSYTFNRIGTQTDPNGYYAPTFTSNMLEFSIIMDSEADQFFRVRIYGLDGTIQEAMLTSKKLNNLPFISSPLTPPNYIGSIQYVSIYLVTDFATQNSDFFVYEVIVRQHCPDESSLNTDTGLPNVVQSISYPCVPLGTAPQKSGFINGFRSKERGVTVKPGIEYFFTMAPIK